MEQEELQMNQEEHQEGYKPRPAWQVWAARVALVIFVIGVILYYVNLFRGV